MTKKEVIRSPFFYVGDKYKLMPEIKNYLPENIKTYVEPFVGGGSSFLNVSAEKFILNDIDTYVIKLHKTLLQYSIKPDVLIEKLFKIIYLVHTKGKLLVMNSKSSLLRPTMQSTTKMHIPN